MEALSLTQKKVERVKVSKTSTKNGKLNKLSKTSTKSGKLKELSKTKINADDSRKTKKLLVPPPRRFQAQSSSSPERGDFLDRIVSNPNLPDFLIVPITLAFASFHFFILRPGLANAKPPSSFPSYSTPVAVAVVADPSSTGRSTPRPNSYLTAAEFNAQNANFSASLQMRSPSEARLQNMRSASQARLITNLACSVTEKNTASENLSPVKTQNTGSVDAGVTNENSSPVNSQNTGSIEKNTGTENSSTVKPKNILSVDAGISFHVSNLNTIWPRILIRGPFPLRQLPAFEGGPDRFLENVATTLGATAFTRVNVQFANVTFQPGVSGSVFSFAQTKVPLTEAVVRAHDHVTVGLGTKLDLGADKMPFNQPVITVETDLKLSRLTVNAYLEFPGRIWSSK